MTIVSTVSQQGLRKLILALAGEAEPKAQMQRSGPHRSFAASPSAHARPPPRGPVA
jgi:hypothetical protein